jgi:hypothetical protein
MPKLVRRDEFRLFALSDNLNESGKYKLMPFKNDAFNENIDTTELSDDTK